MRRSAVRIWLALALVVTGSATAVAQSADIPIGLINRAINYGSYGGSHQEGVSIADDLEAAKNASIARKQAALEAAQKQMLSEDAVRKKADELARAAAPAAGAVSVPANAVGMNPTVSPGAATPRGLSDAVKAGDACTDRDASPSAPPHAAQ